MTGADILIYCAVPVYIGLVLWLTAKALPYEKPRINSALGIEEVLKKWRRK